MQSTAQRWGNSLGLRIPAPMAKDLGVTAGSAVDLSVVEGRLVVTPLTQTRRYRLKDLLKHAKPATLPTPDAWGAPMGKELW